jgi:hypothetical protein
MVDGIGRRHASIAKSRVGKAPSFRFRAVALCHTVPVRSLLVRPIVIVALLALLLAGGWYYMQSRGAAGPTFQAVRIGEAQSGSLTDDHPSLRNRGPYQQWTLRGQRGQRLVIDMASSAFDSYLILRTRDGYAIGVDDDGGGGTNARIRTILPADGNYTIVAASFRPGGRGDYTLTVMDWIVPDVPGAGGTHALAMGATRDGVLEPGDELTGDGPYQDRWTFELAAGQRARVTMSSSDLDSYLILLGPGDSLIGSNDDASGRDAAFMLRSAAGGRYTALATTYGEQPRVGAYRIGLTEITGDVGTPGTISLGETKDGTLEFGDSTTQSGSLVDVFRYTASSSGTVQIDLVGVDGLDTYLTLQDANGMTLTTNDDGGDVSLAARIVYPVTAGSVYRILAGTYGGTARTGRYRLSVNPAPTAPSGPGPRGKRLP